MVGQMPTAPIHTWKSLLLPKNYDSRIFLSHVSKGATQHGTGPAESRPVFTPPEWYPDRLPSRVHLVNDLPFKMQTHLRGLLDHEFYASRAVQKHCTDDSYSERDVKKLRTSPGAAFHHFKSRCETSDFPLTGGAGADMVATHLSDLVRDVCNGLTGGRPLVCHSACTKREVLSTDIVYNRLYDDCERYGKDWIDILWENKSPKAFNHFVGHLMDQLGAHGPSGFNPFPELSPIKYDGYQAILAKVRVVAYVGRRQPGHL